VRFNRILASCHTDAATFYTSTSYYLSVRMAPERLPGKAALSLHQNPWMGSHRRLAQAAHVRSQRVARVGRYRSANPIPFNVLVVRRIPV
jgi:hypothetical protein